MRSDPRQVTSILLGCVRRSRYGIVADGRPVTELSMAELHRRVRGEIASFTGKEVSPDLSGRELIRCFIESITGEAAAADLSSSETYARIEQAYALIELEDPAVQAFLDVPTIGRGGLIGGAT
jgi:hypothetical protein